MTTRRTLIALAAVSSLLAACNGAGGGGSSEPVTTDDVSLGDPNAPVKMIEYASLSCSHCANFNNQVFPDFKAKYIDTGQVYFTSREMLGGYPPFAMAGYLLARCAGEDRYFEVLDDIYRSQTELMMSQQIEAGLKRIGRDNGLSEAEFEACISNPEAIEAIQERSNRYLVEHRIGSTPTFVLGDRRYEGEKSMAELDAMIAEAKAAPAAQ